MSLAIIIAIIAATVSFLTFALYPYGTMSQLAWTEFRKQETTNALCLGSSLGARSFNPMVVDEGLGTTSFNLCTPLQAVSESSLGLQEALDQNDIKYVFYAVDLTALSDEYTMYPGRGFLNEKWKGDGVLQPFQDLAYALPDCSWMFDAKSINWLFPWTEQRVMLHGVWDNMVMQLNGTTVVEAAQHNEDIIDSGWQYYGQGYGGYDTTCDYNAEHQERFVGHGDDPLDETSLYYLGDLCDICREKGIELIAYVPPRPDFGIIDMKDSYREHTDQVKELVEERGGAFYDFNLARPELYDSKEEYYQDWEHCNVIGAEVFSRSLVDLVKRRDAGEDVDALFMTYDEKLASIDSISIVVLRDAVTDQGIELSATCLAGTNVVPEYQFVVTDEQGASTVVQDYSPESTCVYKPPASGVYEARVNARQQGSTAEYEKHTQQSVVYSG